MMLVTRACEPPIWIAMLPQKFSAATTCTTDPDDPDGGPPEPSLDDPHATNNNDPTTANTAATIAARSVRSACVPLISHGPSLSTYENESQTRREWFSLQM